MSIDSQRLDALMHGTPLERAEAALDVVESAEPMEIGSYSDRTTELAMHHAVSTTHLQHQINMLTGAMRHLIAEIKA